MTAKKKLTILERVGRFLSWAVLFGIPVWIVEFLVNAAIRGDRVDPMWAVMLAVLAVVIFHGAIAAWQVPQEE